MDLFDWLWNSQQDRRITETNATLDRAQQQHHRQQDRAEARLDALLLLDAALWEIVRERMNLTDDDLVAKMQEIDLRDGIADGRVGLPSRACRRCNRQTAGRRTTCLYCGESLGPPGPFASAQ